MTPQLMQAIKLLQLSSLDLAAYVEAELEKNPLLERAEPAPNDESAPASERAQAGDDGDGGDDEGGGESLRTESIRERGDDAPEIYVEDSDAGSRQQAAEAPVYSEWANVGVGPGSGGSGGADGEYNLEAFVSAETTLADHLARQLSHGADGTGAAHDRAIPHQSRG